MCRLWCVCVRARIIIAPTRMRLMGTVYRLTPHLQELELQPDFDTAGVVRQPASGGNPVSFLWRAGHVPFVVRVCVHI